MDGAPDLSRRAGGSAGREELVEQAALIALAGIDPMRWFRCSDPLDAAVMVSVAERVHVRAAEIREDQAVRIAIAVGKALFGG